MKTRRAGFTLVETLFAVTVLSLGLLAIFPAFFKSANTLAHLSQRYQASLLMNNLFSDTEEKLRSGEALLPLAQGKEPLGSGACLYTITALPQDGLNRAYLVTVDLEWRDFKENHLSRTALVIR